MLLLAVRYAGANDNISQSNTMYSSAAALYGLLLQNRRKLRLSRTDLKLAMVNYSACIGDIIEEAANYYKNTSGRQNPNDYLFMLERAIGLIDESKKDVMEQNAGEEQVAYLRMQKEALIDMAPESSLLESPPEAMGIILHPGLLDEIMKLKSTSVPVKSGSSKAALAIRYFLAGISIYFAISRQEWWWYGCAAVIIGGLIFNKNNKRI